WTSIGSDTVPMADSVYVGLAVTSHNSGQATTAVIDNVTIGGGGSAGNQPPVVSLTSPANGAVFTAPAPVAVVASASDPENRMSKVDFYQGATLLGTSTAAPYAFTWSNVPAGTYSLKAVAYDRDGGVTSSSVVGITVSAYAGPKKVIFRAPTDTTAVTK